MHFPAIHTVRSFFLIDAFMNVSTSCNGRLHSSRPQCKILAPAPTGFVSQLLGMFEKSSVILCLCLGVCLVCCYLVSRHLVPNNRFLVP